MTSREGECDVTLAHHMDYSSIGVESIHFISILKSSISDQVDKQ